MKTGYKITLVIVSLVLVIIASLGITAFNKKTERETAAEKSASAGKLKGLAIKALEKNQYDEAKTLFEESNKKYTELNDKDNVVDTEAQIYLLEHRGQ